MGFIKKNAEAHCLTEAGPLLRWEFAPAISGRFFLSKNVHFFLLFSALEKMVFADKNSNSQMKICHPARTSASNVYFEGIGGLLEEGQSERARESETLGTEMKQLQGIREKSRNLKGKSHKRGRGRRE